MKKIIALLLCLIICLITSLGCSNKNDQNVPAAQDPADPVAMDSKVITIWYEGGDARLPFFEAVAAEMQKDHAGITINAVTFDNETFMTKALQAATMVGGVDLVFNDASRILELQQQSEQGFLPLDDLLGSIDNNQVVLDADKKLSTQSGSMIVLPVNRTIAGLGVKTDIDGVLVGPDNLPTDFTKFVSLGREFEKNGCSGFTMHLGKDPGQVFNLFLSGDGKNDVWLNSVPQSQIAENKDYFVKIIQLYASEQSIWDKDAIGESFAEMYTKIQGGSVGMFRVGNWNAAKWDAPDSGVGDYTVVPWPSFTDGGEGSLVVLNTRGFAIPKNADHIDEAKLYLQYVYSASAQKSSFDTMGSCLDLSVVDMQELTPNQKIFFDGSVKLTPVDAYAGAFSYYNALLEAYENGLTAAFHADSASGIEGELDKLHEALEQTIQSNQ